MCDGRLFQKLAPETGKARLPAVPSQLPDCKPFFLCLESDSREQVRMYYGSGTVHSNDRANDVMPLLKKYHVVPLKKYHGILGRYFLPWYYRVPWHWYHGKKYRPKIPCTMVPEYHCTWYFGAVLFTMVKSTAPKYHVIWYFGAVLVTMVKSTAPKYHVPRYRNTIVHGILGLYFLPW